MSQNTVDTNQSLALETARQHYAQLETNASAALRQYLNLRGWAIVLATVTTLLAIVSHITEHSLNFQHYYGGILARDMAATQKYLN